MIRHHNEDTYFLDRYIAYQTAILQLEIDRDGETGLQFCYYDGEVFDAAPENLIPVPVSSIAEFFSDNDLPLPTYVYQSGKLNADEENELQAGFQEILRTVNRLRDYNALKFMELKLGPDPNPDSYFLDPQQALEVARQAYRASCDHPTIDGLQICYYDGEPIEDAPHNLINVKAEDCLGYFSTCRTRLPKRIVFPDEFNPNDKQQFSQMFQEIIFRAKQFRAASEVELARIVKVTSPSHIAGEKLRIYFPTSRITTVMQYASRNLAAAFEKLGAQVLVGIEQNEMEKLDGMLRLSEQLEFNPHITVNINHFNNQFLHEDLINIVWFQDQMKDISHGEQIEPRKKDIFYAVPQCSKLMEKSGLTDVMVQHHCVNTDTFHPVFGDEKENKIVFAGSNTSTYEQLPSRFQKRIPYAIQLMDELIETSAAFNPEAFILISQQTELPLGYICNSLFYQRVRTKTLHWLCEEQTLNIEVYGTGWEEDNIVAPFHKGYAEHGEELSKIYSASKYALIPASTNIQLQRLAETSACGCIPVCFDVRGYAEPPYWEDKLLYFRTKAELLGCFNRLPERKPLDIAKEMSYEAFAIRILDEIAKRFPEYESRLPTLAA